jgi:hypothetical protein
VLVEGLLTTEALVAPVAIVHWIVSWGIEVQADSLLAAE